MYIFRLSKCKVSQPPRRARHVFTAAGAQQEKALFRKVYVAVSYMTGGAAGAWWLCIHHGGAGVLCGPQAAAGVVVEAGTESSGTNFMAERRRRERGKEGRKRRKGEGGEF